ncbi:membrane associated rhomboid family serine protease [Lewinella marina]|uniref:Rhomboid family intramembrane serine protease n=1 Tax=Neolewinella marina TaxID=438751 RepID=A0A2G0CHC4_9BACT|nr:rhomboid family intramembrane serine protease [Neolewinella marina]NJB86209.1 membrane associated rhomboid family serine protease [Neolewinella marina]PHK99317.1 rhomboid family intramembrane serine protease [Neolewinella marina]
MPPLTPVVKNLLIINVAVFAILFLLPYLGIDTRELSDFLALHYPTSDRFHPIQLVSHFFVHGGLAHIFFNMFGLVMFGPLLEARYGSKRFLFLYLAAAAGAVALHFGYTWWQVDRMQDIVTAFQSQPSLANFNAFFDSVNTRDLYMDDGTRLSAVIANIQNELVLGGANAEQTLRDGVGMMQEYIDFKTSVPMVGASGALYGVVAAFAILYPDFKLMLIFLPVPIRARYFVPVLLAVDLFLGIMEYSWDPIAHFAHLGGAIAGGVLAYLWYRTDPPAGAQRWDRGVPR